MNNFIRGIIVGAIALVAGVYVYARLGLLELRADQAPRRWRSGSPGPRWISQLNATLPSRKIPCSYSGEPEGGRAPLSRQVLRLPRQPRQPQ